MPETTADYIHVALSMSAFWCFTGLKLGALLALAFGLPRSHGRPLLVLGLGLDLLADLNRLNYFVLMPDVASAAARVLTWSLFLAGALYSRSSADLKGLGAPRS